MKHQEKKYLVSSFEGVRRRLRELGAVPRPSVATTHYYVATPGTDVVKLVDYGDRVEIHVLEKTDDGKFNLTERRAMESREAGLAELADRGFDEADVVRMEDESYDLDGGEVALYTIDESALQSGDFGLSRRAARGR